MAQINIQNLTFGYENNSTNVFDNISFSFDTDWKIGLIGRNGRGKTTLLNLLMKKYEYSGKIVSSVDFDYFPYVVKNKEMFGIDLIEEICPQVANWEVMKKLKELELDEECLYRPFSTLSNGQQTKLLLAILFAKDNNFLLIDEPTNHLDIQSRECVKRFLNKQKGFIVVSHDRDFIDNCVDHIISLNRNEIEIQRGNFSSWWQNKKDKDNAELLQNQALKKEISRLQESMAQKRMWANKIENTKGTRNSGVKVDKGYVGHQTARMEKRAKVIEKRRESAIEEKTKLLKNIDKQDKLFLSADNIKEENLLTIKNLSIFYEDRVIFKNLSVIVDRGEKVAVKGENGSGKSSLLKLICGEQIKYNGTFYKKGKCKISYISQNYEWLSGNLLEFAEESKIDQTRFLTLLYKMGFEREQFNVDIKDFSAGQKKKVLIAKSLCEEADLYVWDEPLNYIDVISRIQIEEMLKNSNITLIFVEHDIAFINNLADKVVEMSK